MVCTSCKKFLLLFKEGGRFASSSPICEIFEMNSVEFCGTSVTKVLLTFVLAPNKTVSLTWVMLVVDKFSCSCLILLETYRIMDWTGIE